METTDEERHFSRFTDSESDFLLHVYSMRRCICPHVDINGYTFDQWAKDNNKTNDDAPFDEWVCMCEQHLSAEYSLRHHEAQSKQYPV